MHENVVPQCDVNRYAFYSSVEQMNYPAQLLSAKWIVEIHFTEAKSLLMF